MDVLRAEKMDVSSLIKWKLLVWVQGDAQYSNSEKDARPWKKFRLAKGCYKQQLPLTLLQIFRKSSNSDQRFKWSV